MVSTRSGLKHETPFEGSNLPLAAMTDTNTLQQLKNHIMGIERHHEEELRKLKANHDRLEARVKCPQNDKLSAHTLMNLYTNDDVILCRVFPMSLKGYATSKSHHMTSTALASLGQANNESFRKFMHRFGRTAVQILNLNPELALHSMLLALQPDKFADSLCKKAHRQHGRVARTSQELYSDGRNVQI
ncbi:hypothetical protein GmHk_07G020486 [Glycine max]|nr:hypothetical protein GmHk_07G020486 [Glycine max]